MLPFEEKLLKRYRHSRDILVVAPGHDVLHPGAIGNSVEHLYVTLFTLTLAQLGMLAGIPIIHIVGDPAAYTAAGPRSYAAAIVEKRKRAVNIARGGHEAWLFEFHLNADPDPDVDPTKVASGAMVIYNAAAHAPVARALAGQLSSYLRAMQAPMVARRNVIVEHRSNLGLLKPLHPAYHPFIVELGFVDNPDEMAWLWGNLTTYALAMLTALNDVLHFVPQEELAVFTTSLRPQLVAQTPTAHSAASESMPMPQMAFDALRQYIAGLAATAASPGVEGKDGGQVVETDKQEVKSDAES